jgi:hypothetical protein
MKFDPVDRKLEPSATSARMNRVRMRSATQSRTQATFRRPAPPEAFDEVFASLAQKSATEAASELPTSFAKPTLNTAPLVALEANLQRQHERIATLLREIGSGISA